MAIGETDSRAFQTFRATHSRLPGLRAVDTGQIFRAGHSMLQLLGTANLSNVSAVHPTQYRGEPRLTDAHGQLRVRVDPALGPRVGADSKHRSGPTAERGQDGTADNTPHAARVQVAGTSRHLHARVTPLLAFGSHACSTSADEMQHEDHDGDDDKDVDERAEVESEEAEQPEHEQDRGNSEQHHVLPIGAPLSETHPEFCTRYMRVVIATSRETGCPAPGAAACAMVLSKPPRARPSRDRVRGIRSLWRWTASTTIRRPACVPSQDRDPRRRAVARLANC